jgi:esterase/lipase superfamily enzyme
MLTRSQRCLVVFVLLSAPGCQRYLVQTPHVLRERSPQKVFEWCPDNRKSPDAPVLYATDRAPEAPNYGYRRASSMAFGTANVHLNPHPTWTEFTQDSTQTRRRREYELHVAEVKELGRVKPTVELAQLGEDTGIRLAAAQENRAQRKHIQELLQARLAETEQKDVYIYIHGFNNSFDDAVFRAAEMWHFMGRTGVPIAYSWPAGLGGIRGYAYDRESGEFTVTHLRHFIRTISECPDVERIHLIAHSRGCDVLISALRELHIWNRAQGHSTQRELKLENVVLAAPDVDEEVFMQRFVGEGLLNAAKRTTIYASQHDKAIELSDLVFASRRRLGKLGARDFNPKMRHALAKLPNVQFIECKLSGVWMSHSYVFTHPAALSDLILVLRDRRPPGAENGRPLRQPAEGLWELNDDYLATGSVR